MVVRIFELGLVGSGVNLASASVMVGIEAAADGGLEARAAVDMMRTVAANLEQASNR
jgi:hypothetical protein